MKCTSKLKVNELYQQSSLLTREVASHLIQHILLSSPCYDVKLDFSDIHFISRSFADQFHKEKIKLFKDGIKEIVVEQAEPDVYQMFKAVSKTQNDDNRPYHTYKVIEINSRRFAKHYLTTLF